MPISKNISVSTILGIDPGFADTGYGVIRSDRRTITYVTCGSIKTSPRKSFPERLMLLENSLSAIIKEAKPDLIAIERLFFFKNHKTVIDVAQARGVALVTAARLGIRIVEYTPPEIKMSLTSFGQAPKPQVARMVQTILKMNDLPRQDDAIDALAIAICAAFRNKL